MDTSNWRGPQTGSGAVGDSSMESGDWRAQLQADSRQRIVNKIMDTLKRHLPFSGHEGLQELKKIAVRFEEKIYTAATSQSDYLRKISLKMLTMETRSQNPMPDAMQSNSGANSVNPSDPGSQVMQQVNSQGQPLPIPVPSNHPQQGQQLLSQAIHNNIVSTVMQGTSSLSSALPPGTGLSQSSISNLSGQNPTLQNIQNVQQNSVGNPMGPGVVPSNSFANQRQIPGRQQPLAPQQQQQQQQQQQSQNSHYLYQQQQLQQIAKQKLQVQQGNIAPSMQQMQQQQQQQQQQNLLQPGHQQSVMQPTMLQSVQNQQTVVPQSSQPLMNHQQSALRQQRQQQVQVQPTQQQVQVQPTQSNPMGQQPNATNMQQNQLIGQQNSYSDMQQQQRLLGQQNKPQQHLIGQHNNLSCMQQQHMGGQSSQSGGQQQLLGTQSGNSGMQHMMQSKIPVQQQNQQSSGTLLPTQVQQSQQQVMPHMQAQSGQVGMQQQPNMMQGNMQQRLPASGGFQQQNVIDQQKQLFQQQRPMQEASSTSLDSTAQTGNANGGDWQEEVYQKIKAMKDLYLLDLNDMHQKILGKLQQHDSLPQQPKNEQLEKLKVFKNMLERFMAFLQIPKHNILANYKDKLSTYEKQIVHVITSNRRKPAAAQQQQQQQPPQQPQQLPPPHMQSQSQQTHSQLTHENPMSSQMQTVGGLQQSSLSGGSNSQQTMMNSMQPTSNLDSVSGSGSGSQQVNINPMVSHGAMGTLQPNPNLLHIKQQEQLLQSQQLKQFQNRQMQQQYLHKQQLMQQQQFRQQQQQGNQVNQISQLHDNGDMKLRQQQQQMGGKAGSFQQRAGYHQQMKPGGSPFSPQLIPGGGSPQISQHASPQIEGQNMFKPMQSTNSPFTVPSPSTPSASPLPGDFERMGGGVSSALTNIGHGHGHGHGQSSGAVLTSQSLAIGTPGISASPLLAEFTSPDGNGVVASIGSGKSSAAEQPLERLLKVVKSISGNALSGSVSDIGSVVSMIDRIAGSAPGNGSRAAVGEDLVAMTKCRLQARTFVTQDGNGTNNAIRKMKRFTSAMPLNVVSSAGSVNDNNNNNNNTFKHSTCAETSELDSTASSAVKRPRIETNNALMEEIKEINRGLIDTVVGISEEDVDPAAASEGTVIKCSFSAVALGPNLKSQYASAQMSPIRPLRLLVPANYPNCSPILLDKFPVEVSKEYEDLSVKAKSRFSISLRSLSQPMSLKEIARTWDVCARAVISEYAQQSGGGTFSSKYGTWDNCLTAA